MKRLAAMQDWPLLIVRALTAVDGGGLEVGARHHDERVASAELQHGLLDLGARRSVRRETPAPSLPVSVTAAMRGILDELRDAVGADEEGLEGAFREPGLAEDLLDRQRAVRERSRRA